MSFSSTFETVRVERRAAPSSAAAAYGSFEASLELPCWLRDEPEAERGTAVFQLVVLSEGEPLGRQVFLRDSLTLGRSPECGLRLDDPAVSRVHARIESGVLIDEASTNGVSVNGRRVARAELQDGDVIRISLFELVYQRAEGALPSPRAYVDVRAPASRPQPRSDEDAIHLALGKTLRLNPEGPGEDPVPSVTRRAYLQVHSNAKRILPRALQFVVERDAFLIGRDPGCDLRLQGWWIPRVAAVIVRCHGGFTLDPLARWPTQVRLGERVQTRVLPLEDHDRITIAGQTLTFRLGAPTT